MGDSEERGPLNLFRQKCTHPLQITVPDRNVSLMTTVRMSYSYSPPKPVFFQPHPNSKVHPTTFLSAHCLYPSRCTFLPHTRRRRNTQDILYSSRSTCCSRRSFINSSPTTFSPLLGEIAQHTDSSLHCPFQPRGMHGLHPEVAPPTEGEQQEGRLGSTQYA